MCLPCGKQSPCHYFCPEARKNGRLNCQQRSAFMPVRAARTHLQYNEVPLGMKRYIESRVDVQPAALARPGQSEPSSSMGLEVCVPLISNRDGTSCGTDGPTSKGEGCIPYCTLSRETLDSLLPSLLEHALDRHRRNPGPLIERTGRNGDLSEFDLTESVLWMNWMKWSCSALLSAKVASSNPRVKGVQCSAMQAKEAKSSRGCCIPFVMLLAFFLDTHAVGVDIICVDCS
ncbi:hypothetical protein B0H66DRAFT_266838 [Apodospora peruviana]|uniref:Uncharacterized protein n=1 Tax=Apodospora peruviana TaxID=516989 RepID=A0AAE0I6F6_9PEZI|nr:hypothetical protein B0H66DRAFT_266838 [Apodospora peruviana]